MVGKLIIDGVDAYSEYGVFVEQYGYKSLIQMPQFKNVTATEWDEYDGEEPDLLCPLLGSKTFSIMFCIVSIDNAGGLYELLSNKAYHVFNFIELGRSYKLRLVSTPSFDSFVRSGKMTLNFADDFPPVVITPETDINKLDQYNIHLQETPMEQAPAGFKQKGYLIDNVDLSMYGVYVVDGTIDNINKAPEIRSKLKIDTGNRAGLMYDDKIVHYKAKDTELNLFIIADGMKDFWKRWYGLFTAILKPDKRVLYVDLKSEDYECYYKSNNVSRFDILPNGKVWCEFSVTMRFINNRPIGNNIILSTEDGYAVITEPEESEIVILV